MWGWIGDWGKWTNLKLNECNVMMLMMMTMVETHSPLIQLLLIIYFFILSSVSLLFLFLLVFVLDPTLVWVFLFLSHTPSRNACCTWTFIFLLAQMTSPTSWKQPNISPLFFLNPPLLFWKVFFFTKLTLASLVYFLQVTFLLKKELLIEIKLLNN